MKRQAALDRTALSKAVDEYRTTWLVADRVLLQMCNSYPHHHDPAIVNAKLLIIGRSYASGLERKIAATGAQNSALSKVTQLLVNHSDEVDQLIARLPRKTSHLSAELLQTVLDVHGEFSSLIRSITYKKQAVRSFASKYLHFHRPFVPMFDSFADRAATRLVRWRRELDVAAKSQSVDYDYHRYLMRFWHLYEQAITTESPPTVKEFDYYLLCEADDTWTSRDEQ